MAFNQNNQPVIKDGLVGIHNGIIVNDNDLWGRFPSLTREYEVDTEVLLGLLRFFFENTGSLTTAAQQTFQHIEGSASIAVFFDNSRYLLLATNTGSLYTTTNPAKNLRLFASERYILQKLLKKNRRDYPISQVAPGTGYLIHTHTLDALKFSLDPDSSPKPEEEPILTLIRIKNISPPRQPENNNPIQERGRLVPSTLQDRYQQNLSATRQLKRCTKCVLPETMPHLTFDNDGVCSYCRNYRKIEVRGEETLENLIAPYRRQKGKANCLVALSGGRDSSYGLHYIKNILEMNPVAYSYDWGMLTDLGRRNQARMCGKLGIEHLLVSADITQKRNYIRKNVLAWLKRPNLGTVPLFMAGDKQYFYYANKLNRQIGAKLIIYSENPLEKTDFKSGFCGVKPEFRQGDSVHSVNFGAKAKIAAYYLKEYLSNPAYLNPSLLDTLSAYASFYLIPHNYLYLYRFIRWDEKTVNSTLINDYNWETAPDTTTTWRIGDGTAAFYNYIYHTVAGFTENDTFRSNQIREGLLTRKEALALIEEENKPRPKAIQWYCDAIGINAAQALATIDTIPKLYPSIQ